METPTTKQLETPVPQETQAVSETGIETVLELDAARLKRDVRTYYTRSKTMKSEEARKSNFKTFLQRKQSLEKLGYSVVEQHGTIFTIDPRKN